MPLEVCSPLYRCFPPQATVCVICGKEDGSECLIADGTMPRANNGECDFDCEVYGGPHDCMCTGGTDGED